MATPSNNIDTELIQSSMDKLYKIDADVSPELYQLIDTMRQLINEEFVHAKRQITSQSIYDILDPYLKVDRNKLIKHLALQLGEDEEHLRKLVEMVN